MKMRVGNISSNIKRTCCVLFASLLILVQFPLSSVVALSEACTVDITPTLVAPMSETVFTVTYQNTGSVDLQWLRVQRPSNKITINGITQSGWTDATDSTGTLLSSSVLSAGQTFGFELAGFTGEALATSEVWNVQASSSPSGSSPIICTGSASFSIAGNPDNTADNGISSVTPQNITANDATITWQSDNPATSVVYYGTSANYGSYSTVNSATDVSHSVTLTGLTPSTRYHFQVAGVDIGGNIASSADYTFDTVAAAPGGDGGSTGGDGSGNTGGGTGNGSGNVTPTGNGSTNTSRKPVSAVDVTSPVVVLDTPKQKVYGVSPHFTGSASDNNGVASVDYSTDNGQNWLPAEITKPSNAKQIVFGFTPVNLRDGSYQIRARATDTSGNRSISGAIKIVIDVSPPRSAGIVFYRGGQVMSPDQNGTYESVENESVKIYANVTGGPEEVLLQLNALNESKQVQTFPLLKSSDNGIWSAQFSPKNTGTYTVNLSSVDGANNKNNLIVGKLRLLSRSHIVDAKTKKQLSSTVTVYQRDQETNSWEMWDGQAFGQPNPYIANDGAFGLLLPEGTFYLKVTATGYKNLTSASFTVTQTTNISEELQLHAMPKLKLGTIQIHVPWFNLSTVKMHVQKLSNSSPSFTPVQLPSIKLPRTDDKNITTLQLLGKPSVITFVSTWTASALDQLTILNTINSTQFSVVPVVSGESVEKLKAFMKIGNYNLPIAADVDSAMANSLTVGALPTHYFVDRHGVIKKVITGVLTKQELYDNIAN